MRDIWKYHRFFTLGAGVIAWALLTGTPGFAGDFPGDGVDGEPLEYKLKNDGQVIVDKNTKLEWELKVDGGDGESCLDNLHGVDARCTWAQALEWIDMLNAENYAGHSDWRLPNVRELMSILDYSRANPAIDPIFDPTAAALYWSSTTFLVNPSSAWVVSFSGGSTNGASRDDSFPVRAVRGGS